MPNDRDLIRTRFISAHLVAATATVLWDMNLGALSQCPGAVVLETSGGASILL